MSHGMKKNFCVPVLVRVALHVVMVTGVGKCHTEIFCDKKCLVNTCSLVILQRVLEVVVGAGDFLSDLSRVFGRTSRGSTRTPFGRAAAESGGNPHSAAACRRKRSRTAFSGQATQHHEPLLPLRR